MTMLQTTRNLPTGVDALRPADEPGIVRGRLQARGLTLEVAVPMPPGGGPATEVSVTSVNETGHGIFLAALPPGPGLEFHLETEAGSRILDAEVDPLAPIRVLAAGESMTTRLDLSDRSLRLLPESGGERRIQGLLDPSLATEGRIWLWVHQQANAIVPLCVGPIEMVGGKLPDAEAPGPSPLARLLG